MNVIKYKDVLKTYQRIDLYRAKYRHVDFTPFAWCFHGNKSQHWMGTCVNGNIQFSSRLVYNAELNIDPSVYKYISFRFATPGYTPKLMRYKIRIYYNDTFKDVVVPYIGQLQTMFTDMSQEESWADAITSLSFEIYGETANNTWSLLTTNTYCEYIKVDQENVFANIMNGPTITEIDFNEMRNDIETFAKQPIDWGTPEGRSRVMQFIDTIKKEDIDQANQKIAELSPYNGCATCDNFQCDCDGTDYGHVSCQACDVCDAYQGCSTCDQTCHGQAVSCTCNGICYSQPTGCSCNGTCYGYGSCSCNGSCNSCYSGNTSCSSCNGSCYTQTANCSSCYGTYMTCTYQHTDTVTQCNLCYVRSDAQSTGNCRTYTNGACSCNQTCYGYQVLTGTWTCNPSCYVETCTCQGGNTGSVSYSCSVCNGTCYSQSPSCSSCYSGYGSSGCSSCNSTCYGQPTACGCNSGCYTQPTACTCNARCYNFAACSACDGCDSYLACSCDSTCFSESCEQCHKSGYSSVPI